PGRRTRCSACCSGCRASAACGAPAATASCSEHACHQAGETMRTIPSLALAALVALANVAGPGRAPAGDAVKEVAVEAPNQVAVKVRMEGPYTADVPLQVVCYFKYTPEGAKRMSGAPVELDKHLGGVIASLRERGEFTGDQLETILITPPKDSINAKALLLAGLGT